MLAKFTINNYYFFKIKINLVYIQNIFLKYAGILKTFIMLIQKLRLYTPLKIITCKNKILEYF